MAENIIPFSSARQEGLRSFIVYDELPEGCFAFEAVDNCSAPHFRQGDFAIVDPNDCAPMHGEMFVVQWEGGARQIVDCRLLPCRVVPRDGGDAFDTKRWWVGWQGTMTSLDGRERETARWHDGPYTEDHLREKLVGRIVGIYEPDFRRELKLAA